MTVGRLGVVITPSYLSYINLSSFRNPLALIGFLTSFGFFLIRYIPDTINFEMTEHLTENC